jgi:predicted nuclease of predicted toxin-antitoxin system
MQFLIDMNLSPRLADLLVNAGHQAVYWGTIGKADAEDSEILTWAKNNDYVLLTNDLDFGTILATRGLKSPSVIQFRRRDVLPETIISFILQAAEKFSDELHAGALIVVDERRFRVRLLPLFVREDSPRG